MDDVALLAFNAKSVSYAKSAVWDANANEDDAAQLEVMLYDDPLITVVPPFNANDAVLEKLEEMLADAHEAETVGA